VALLGNLTGSSQFFSDELFYNDVATQSLRLDNSASSLLTRTPSAGNRKTWTWSAWIKRGDIGRDQDFFTAEGSGGQLYAIMITSGDQLQIYAASAVLLLSNQVLRDLSAWYHIVVKSDTTQGTASDRLKIYLNGSEITSFATDNRASYAQNTDYGINSNVKHNIGSNQAGGNFGDYYIAEVNFVDGNAYDASYFGETKNGVWIPKKYTGSYGTNGFRLQLDQTGVGTASTSTIGADTSGNTHHFTSSGIAASDCNMPDSPENNFPTMNALEFQENNSGAFLAEGNLKFSNVNANINSTFGFGNSGGKYYWEYLYVSSTDSNHYQGVTLPKDGVSIANAFNTGIALYFHDGTTRVDGTSGTGFGGQIGADNIIQFKLDLDNGTLQFGKNNTYISALTLPTSIGGWRAGGIQSGGTGGTRVFVANYGQDSSFAGNKTAQGNTDENGIGDFFYAPPSGFLALCTANLPEPTIGPNSLTQADDHFNTVLWTGNGSNSHGITGVGFKPDWVWIKERTNASSHYLIDSSRGLGTGDSFRALISDGTDAEYTSLNDQLRTLDSDGFTLDDNTDTNFYVNRNNETYVGWNWKANGGTTSSNSDGSITSTVQANTTAGFSIVLYTGSESNATVGHGLGGVPDMLIWKKRNGVNDWIVYHSANTSEPATDHLHLNNANATSDPSGSTFFQDTLPTSTVFSIGTDDDVNDAKNYVVYCFRSIEGYSKFGQYTSNGASDDNTFVYTGFRPAFLLVKMTPSGTEWVMMDNKKSSSGGGNPIDRGQYPNYNYAEYSGNKVDFLSNGFKVRDTSGVGYSTRNVIYMAFAEAPFKYANAR